MALMYEGIGQWGATFYGGAAEKTPVKVNAAGKVEACGAEDAFCGVVLAQAADGKACTVQLGGLATVVYSGTAPQTGWVTLVADGAGGVKAAGAGHAYQVVCVDTAAKTVTFVL